MASALGLGADDGGVVARQIHTPPPRRASAPPLRRGGTRTHGDDRLRQLDSRDVLHAERNLVNLAPFEVQTQTQSNRLTLLRLATLFSPNLA